jgi:hypothetical protein
MRAKEFITEHTGKAHPEHDSVHQGYSKVRDPGGYYPSYHQMRTGIVLGMMDGSSDKIKAPHESWMGPYWTQHPYTETEHNMFAQARKTIPTEHHQVQKWSKSVEPETTYKVSPVAKRKKNKYGV